MKINIEDEGFIQEKNMMKENLKNFLLKIKHNLRFYFIKQIVITQRI